MVAVPMEMAVAVRMPASMVGKANGDPTEDRGDDLERVVLVQTCPVVRGVTPRDSGRPPIVPRLLGVAQRVPTGRESGLLYAHHDP